MNEREELKNRDDKYRKDNPDSGRSGVPAREPGGQSGEPGRQGSGSGSEKYSNPPNPGSKGSKPTETEEEQ